MFVKKKIIGILGGGQLGMMLCQVAKKLNIQTFIYTDSNDSPAIKYANNNANAVVPRRYIIMAK